ncbi:protein YgfX [Undibacterium luofuense]|uniref:protein YgfX n=1 Tax=Undibacterium luofuense TaxID=2828733 RepID=UPI003C6F7D28
MIPVKSSRLLSLIGGLQMILCVTGIALTVSYWSRALALPVVMTAMILWLHYWHTRVECRKIILFKPDGRLGLLFYTRNGVSEFNCLASDLNLTWLISLRAVDERSQDCQCLITMDMMTSEEWRQLRVFLAGMKAEKTH